MRAYLHLTHPRGTFTLTTVGKNYRYESGRAVKDPSLRQDDRVKEALLLKNQKTIKSSLR